MLQQYQDIHINTIKRKSFSFVVFGVHAWTRQPQFVQCGRMDGRQMWGIYSIVLCIGLTTPNRFGYKLTYMHFYLFAYCHPFTNGNHNTNTTLTRTKHNTKNKSVHILPYHSVPPSSHVRKCSYYIGQPGSIDQTHPAGTHGGRASYFFLLRLLPTVYSLFFLKNQYRNFEKKIPIFFEIAPERHCKAWFFEVS